MNGTIGKVDRITEHTVYVQFYKHNSNEPLSDVTAVSRETFSVMNAQKKEVATRRQFPIILAYAMTIHKAQGQTLSLVKIDLGKVFERGQAYVAVSRATSLDGLWLQGFRKQLVMADQTVVEFHRSLGFA